MDRNDLVKIVAYFIGDRADEERYVSLIADWLGPNVRPVISTISMPELCYPDMRVEIEGVAMRGVSGERLSRQSHQLDGLPNLHRAFSHVVRCDEMIFTGDITDLSETNDREETMGSLARTKLVMDRVVMALNAVGADAEDVVKTNIFYDDSGGTEDWEKIARMRAEYYPDPGPAATGIPVAGFPNPEITTKVIVTAMRDGNGSRMDRTYSWPEGHWDWTIPLPYKHGNKCGQMIHLGGQVSLDSSANVIDPEDMVAQTRRAMQNVANILAEFGATLDDIVKVTTFYQGSASAEALHENLLVRSSSYTEPGPATTGIPVPNLVYENMVIEIDVIAMIET